MKTKKYKYLLVFILMLIIGVSTVYAANPASCDSIFGSPEDPKSLMSFFNEILMYPKIIVPLIIVGLGTVDFAKAVFAAKEDEMKKAQITFVKRVLIGVGVFFVPEIVKVLMYIADIALSGANYCGL